VLDCAHSVSDHSSRRVGSPNTRCSLLGAPAGGAFETELRHGLAQTSAGATQPPSCALQLHSMALAAPRERPGRHTHGMGQRTPVQPLAGSTCRRLSTHLGQLVRLPQRPTGSREHIVWGVQHRTHKTKAGLTPAAPAMPILFLAQMPLSLSWPTMPTAL
jgi:hypothetical protein